MSDFHWNKIHIEIEVVLNPLIPNVKYNSLSFLRYSHFYNILYGVVSYNGLLIFIIFHKTTSGNTVFFVCVGVCG